MLSNLTETREEFTRHEPAAVTRFAVGDRWRMAAREARQLFNLADSWFERFELARFLTELYVARALPLDTYAWDTSVRLRGMRYSVGLRTSEIYVLEEVLSYHLYDRIEHYVPRAGWTVFDLGANVGIVSILAAKRGAEVYAFEPNPDCFRRLLKSMLANGLEERIHAFNLALGAKVGSGTLQVVRGGTTGGTVLVGDSTEPAQRVSVTTLDQMVSAVGVSRIDLLKIDVEGAEADVLRGAERALAMAERTIIEYHSAELLREIEAILTQQGLVSEKRVVYFPEIPARGQVEVGMLYARRIRH